MTASIELDLKQRLVKLSERDRLAMSAYLLRLKHSSKSGRRGVSKLMKEMDAGKKTVRILGGSCGQRNEDR